MLVRFAVSYDSRVSARIRQIFEFFLLSLAVLFFFALIYVHVIIARNSSSCFDHIRDTWPRKGVLRIEVINNLKDVLAREELLKTYPPDVTPFNIRRILIGGPAALPLALRFKKEVEGVTSVKRDSFHVSSAIHDWLFSGAGFSSIGDSDDSFWQYFLKPVEYNHESTDYDVEDLSKNIAYEGPLVEDVVANDEYILYEYVVEYSLFFGVLRLPQSYRTEVGIPSMIVQLDADEEECFGDWTSRLLMKYFIGYEDVLLSSVKSLATNDSERGFVRDLRTGENYRFVTSSNTRWSTLTALLVMLIFTFAISMLLRFSHHQIFLFIVDLLQMFEHNQPLIFPAAPLLTVILALVGMEAIMSEVFNDTSTAFYVILMVWVADQYDAICCHSSISKRHWLRFFYLYHFTFYAYQYRFNGQYGGFALLTSALFVLHSMVYFFHHYEMPLILYQERLQHVIRDLQQGGGQDLNRQQPNRSASADILHSHFHVQLDRQHASSSSAVTIHGNNSERIQANISVRAQNNSSSSASPYYDALLQAGRRTAEDVFERAYRDALSSGSGSR
uniref:Membralin n=1 Tax=Steinernema glaseri TaxID=37863 RepID=A0A1I7XWT2_9BILA